MTARKHRKRRKKHAKRFLTVLLILLLLVAAGGLFLLNFRIIRGRVYRIGETIDLTEYELTPREYEDILSSNPGAEIVWTVPIGDNRYDSRSESVTVGEFSAVDIPNFAYFPLLKTVDGTRSHSLEALAALRQAYPQLAVSWLVPLSDSESYPDTAVSAAVTGNTSFEKLSALLPYLPALTELDLRGAAFAGEDELEALKAAFPELRVYAQVSLLGQSLDCESTSLSFPELPAESLPELIAAADDLPNVTEISLGTAVYPADLIAALREAYRGATVRCHLSFYGVEVDALAEEMDFSGIPITDTSAIGDAVRTMPALKKIVMSDCGIPDAEMDALNRQYETVRIVWTVYIKGYECRTDADNFCISRITSRYGDIFNEHVAPLQYCTDMVTLDLGHMYFDDISFVANMPHLRHFIIGDTLVTDLSPLENCQELYYLEMFLTPVKDLSPLTRIPSLRHLNIGYVRPDDYSPICQMTWLDRLWWIGHNLPQEARNDIIASLPNTKVCFYDGESSVPSSWRNDDSYREMRDNLGMWYNY